MPVKFKKKPGFDPRLKAKIVELREAGHNEWYIEGFTKGWLMAAAKLKKAAKEAEK